MVGGVAKDAQGVRPLPKILAHTTPEKTPIGRSLQIGITDCRQQNRTMELLRGLRGQHQELNNGEPDGVHK